VKETGRPSTSYTPKKRNRLACATVKNIVKVHCNLRLVDSIEEIGRSDTNIDWSSDEDLD